MVNDAAGGRGLRTLVLGGARSGKSAYAEEVAGHSGPVRYVATAVPDPADADFADRIAAHRVRRPGTWHVVEGDPITVLGDSAPVTLIDDLGTWLTARIDARAAWDSPRGTVGPDIDALVAAVTGYADRLLIVSPEVGLGVVPATASGRLFQDEIGTLNQRLAAVCDEVVLVVAGVPVVLKGAGASTGSGIAAASAAAEKALSAGHDADGGGSTASGAGATAVGSVAGSTPRGLAEFDGTTPAFGPVAAPDARVRAEAEQRQLQLTKPAGALGRLETLGNWVAACQGQCPPQQFRRARVVVFAGDHGVARHGVSAYPSEVTAQMVANFLAGGAAVNALARLADATVRVVDIAVDADTDPSVSAHKIRRASGAIDREDALTEAELYAALAAGRAIADEEIDSGADLLIAGDMGIGNTTPATVLIATLTDTEPVVAIGRGTGVDDAGWMRKASAIRDAMWRARPHRQDPFALLRIAGGADFAATAGYLAQAAARRTPVILDGVVVTAAALIAEMLAPGAKRWWVAGHRSTEPAHPLALAKLDLEPLVELNMRLGEGSGAVSALPLLRAAIAALSEMSTFGEAGVSTAESDSAAPEVVS
ncbi:nicotinate-nucleotide--dimethylbenzimidazole phosphoribosyltransferase [Nocardia nova]|uniref:Nicotinate-nucleotide--dimethylbenzimidazole phosphoribosyltransferase n=1 Tax=Nocardia nova TaxID=37330 RepID=A0A2S6ATP3_9NOCA|nr:nicotinate-nucleotide--dimethylbenzimidazole phosphoribosyltransferase [Nocardia nova]PPJ23983.1 nicotinate-nucleotide--dimethylbenzimidazole phosphoribosyltransferase [Nocardia nova]PPJ38647.1 nicotinate-nucleotide--dimethylbenzimidazole phosphoribosyltransferase [Nocardia nova]